MSVSLSSTDAVPAHALRRGTRGFAAVVLFLTGVIVFAVTAFVIPSIALSGTLLTALVLLGIGYGIAHFVAIYGVLRRRPWAVSITLYLLAIGLGLIAFGTLMLWARVDPLAAAGAESTAPARVQVLGLFVWLAASWAGFSCFTGWWVNALGLHSVGEAIAIAAAILACCFLVTAQRRLSTPVRELRRRTVAVEGEQRLADGTVKPVTRDRLIAPLDGALKALSVAVPLLAVALLAIRT